MHGYFFLAFRSGFRLLLQKEVRCHRYRMFACTVRAELTERRRYSIVKRWMARCQLLTATNDCNRPGLYRNPPYGRQPHSTSSSRRTFCALLLLYKNHTRKMKAAVFVLTGVALSHVVECCLNPFCWELANGGETVFQARDSLIQLTPLFRHELPASVLDRKNFA